MRSRPARCCCGSTPARPSRTPPPATRRCRPRAPRSRWRRKEFERQKQLFAEELHQPGRARPRRGAVQGDAGAGRGAAGRSAGAARTQSGFYVVKAPYDGVVADVAVVLGDMAMPGRPLLTLYDPAALRVSVAVPQIGRGAHGRRAGRCRSSCPALPAARSGRAGPGASAADGRPGHPHARAAARPAGRPAGRHARACSPAPGCRSPRGADAAALRSGAGRRAARRADRRLRARTGRPCRCCARCGSAAPPDDTVEVLAGVSRRRARRARSAGRGARSAERTMNATRSASPAASPPSSRRAQITPLLALVALLLGVFAVLVTPREEEPQINVTMANVLIPFPGASVRDVEQMVATPAEQVLSQIAGIEHVMSVSRPGLAVVTVQFKVGVPRTEALVRLYDTVNANADWLPARPGRRRAADQAQGHRRRADRHADAVQQGPRAIGAFDLERVAHSVEAELKRVPGTREVATIGGPGRAVRGRDRPGAHGRRRRHRGRPAPGAAVGQPRRAGRRTARRQPRGRASSPVPSCATRATSASWWSACATAGRCSCRTWPRVRDGPLPAQPLCLARRRRQRTAASTRPSRSPITKKPGENADRRRQRRDARVDDAAQHRHPARRRGRRDAQLRRDRQRQGAEADPEAAVRHRLGRRAGVPRARPARGRDRRQRGDPHARRRRCSPRGPGASR